MAKKEEIEFETEESSSILDDIYDIAHDIFPDATERFHWKAPQTTLKTSRPRGRRAATASSTR